MSAWGRERFGLAAMAFGLLVTVGRAGAADSWVFWEMRTSSAGPPPRSSFRERMVTVESRPLCESRAVSWMRQTYERIKRLEGKTSGSPPFFGQVAWSPDGGYTIKWSTGRITTFTHECLPATVDTRQ